MCHVCGPQMLQRLRQKRRRALKPITEAKAVARHNVDRRYRNSTNAQKRHQLSPTASVRRLHALPRVLAALERQE